MPGPASFRGFVDESSAVRSADRQEYLVGAALVAADQCERVREQLRPLLLPGQVKLHWTDESEARRRRIVRTIAALEPMNVVITQLSARQAKTERFRRKCLEDLYHEMVGMEVFDLTLETRSRAQDSKDRAHIVALQGQGLDRRLRIDHLRGGDEPLLWIADIVLGAINAAHLGDPAHLEQLSSTVVVYRATADSLRSRQSERP